VARPAAKQQKGVARLDAKLRPMARLLTASRAIFGPPGIFK